MKIKFGPHADKEVSELPKEYVKQLLEKVRIRDRRLLKELKDSLLVNNTFEELNLEDPEGNWE